MAPAFVIVPVVPNRIAPPTLLLFALVVLVIEATVNAAVPLVPGVAFTFTKPLEFKVIAPKVWLLVALFLPWIVNVPFCHVMAFVLGRMFAAGAPPAEKSRVSPPFDKVVAPV